MSRSHSWLSYGAEKIQERLWSAISSSIQKGESILQRRASSCSVASPSGDKVCDWQAGRDPDDDRLAAYLNPCMLVGHRETIGAYRRCRCVT